MKIHERFTDPQQELGKVKNFQVCVAFRFFEKRALGGLEGKRTELIGQKSYHKNGGNIGLSLTW